ncbi:unnamed protein product [Rotaria sp. Silwood1]|nr:unnamed protein product [Rotaria sp. Silwood1]CAF1418700.1 unnamed protein product [Rotaria sp. Silwood1]CAF3609715.1 unnamed protein product [Rotaria sp. Silwood1]CAF3717171.1 unnamed protein product [Rotaria sp. Silwood1]CAF4885042.1 unnamed protein product [Rotaria sp. Silwood1]
MQVVFILSLVFICSTLHIQLVDSSIQTRGRIINKPICLVLSDCQVKCKRYIIRNRCPTCECNPCVYGQPLYQISCGQGDQKCLLAGGLCKIHSWYNKPYCCPKEHDGYCPSMSNEDTDILFPCVPQCYSDSDCKVDEKCCGTCIRKCMKAFIA